MAREVVEALRQRHRRAPGRHRPLPARPSTSAARASCSRRQSRLPRARPTRRRVRCRRRRSPSPPRSRTSALPLAGRVEIEHHRGRTGALARVPESASSTCIERLFRRSSSTWRSPTASSSPELAAKGIMHDVLVRPNIVLHVLQHGGPGRRRLRAGEDRAAPRDRHGVQRRRGDPRARARAARCPRNSPIPPDIAGYDPKLRSHGAALRSRGGARAARQVRLQGSRRRRLPRDARRQAARARALVDADLARSARATSCGRRTWTRSASSIEFKKDKRAGASQDGAARQDPDARRRLERRLSGRRELHAAALRSQRGQENQAQFNLPEFNELYEKARAFPTRRSARSCSIG